MAVPCPRCGRQYDVTLFAFGRTIWCTCGGRVGAEVRERRLDEVAGPRFAADAMLGRLARWLRILGFDCSYDAEIADAELVEHAWNEGRTILTRDRSLPVEWRVSGIHRVRAERTFEQLREVLRTFDLERDVHLFSRCSACNRSLEPARPGEVAGRVPDRILATHERFQRCPGCSRVYWRGSHTERIERVVERLLATG